MSEVAQAGVRGFHQIDEVLWELPAQARSDMRVPARVFADRELIDQIARDRSLEQLQNVATLPGLVGAAMAMPDIHQGYGFPVGGVAATEPPDGVVSPGGVGYDINCGVRLLALPLGARELSKRVEPLVHEISRRVPVGTGRGGALALGGAELDRVMVEGPRALLGRGIGSEEELERTESNGCLEGAEPGAVSDRARRRGADQLGTLGSGNHFLELQRVGQIFDRDAADAFGLRDDQVTVLIHSGSRGFATRSAPTTCGRWRGCSIATGSRWSTGSWRARRSSRPRGGGTSGRWRARRTSPGPTARRWRTRSGRRSRASLDRSSPSRRTASTTSPTTSPSSSSTAAAPCACTARGRRAPSPPARRRSRALTEALASRCSSPGAWARAASSSSACRVRSSNRSGRPATAPGGG